MTVEPSDSRTVAPRSTKTTNRRLTFALAAFVLPLAVYLAGMRYVGSGDTVPAELLPISVLTRGTLDFDQFFPGGRDLPYAFRRIGTHVVSSYPVLPGLVNVPVYAAGLLLGVDLYFHRERLSLLTASLVAALSVLFLFLVLDRLCRSTGEALFFALLYALGTCVWSVASHGMWQHGPSLFFLTAALWCLARQTAVGDVAAGLLFTLAVLNRPTNAVLALPVAVLALVRRRRAVPRFAAGGLLPLALHAIYAWKFWGTPFSLSNATASIVPTANFGGKPLVGIAGLLVSPSRGIFVFSPFLLVGAWGIAAAVRRQREDPLPFGLLLGALLLVLVTSKWTIWWGGHTFGYRLLIETLPSFVVLVAIGWRERVGRSGALRTAFLLAVLWSIGVQALGAFGNWTPFNERMDGNPAILWSVRDSQILQCARDSLGHRGR